MCAVAGGPPNVLRMDNDPEFISQVLQQFCDGKARMSYIPPGTPWDTGHIANRPGESGDFDVPWGTSATKKR